MERVFPTKGTAAGKNKNKAEEQTSTVYTTETAIRCTTAFYFDIPSHTFNFHMVEIRKTPNLSLTGNMTQIMLKLYARPERQMHPACIEAGSITEIG